MAATVGTAIFAGLSTGKNYVKDLYLSDSVGTPVNIDGGLGASATSPEDWTPPEPVLLVDLAIVTGAAQTRLGCTINGVLTGDILRHTVQVDTQPTRPRPNVPILAGARFAILQLA